MSESDDRPAGDTPEAHDEISPHDLPPDHPGRKAAEEQAEPVTRGHRQGGADDADEDLGDRERGGAQT